MDARRNEIRPSMGRIESMGIEWYLDMNLCSEKIEELKSYFSNKRVILVGNSSDLLKSKFGYLIDSYDIVIRIGGGTPTPDRRGSLGGRTNIWCFGIMRCDNYKFFRDSDYFFFVYGKCQTPPKSRIPLEYRDKLIEINSPEQYQAHKEKSGIQRPSTGNIMIDFMVNSIKTYRKLSLIGFDFFSCKVENGKSKSFHKETKMFDVHDGKLERDFATRLAKAKKIKILKF